MRQGRVWTKETGADQTTSDNGTLRGVGRNESVQAGLNTSPARTMLPLKTPRPGAETVLANRALLRQASPDLGGAV